MTWHDSIDKPKFVCWFVYHIYFTFLSLSLALSLSLNVSTNVDSGDTKLDDDGRTTHHGGAWRWSDQWEGHLIWSNFQRACDRSVQIPLNKNMKPCMLCHGCLLSKHVFFVITCIEFIDIDFHGVQLVRHCYL